MKNLILIATCLGPISGHFRAPRRAILIFAAAVLGALTLTAQTNSVKLGNFAADRTRILAKFKGSALVDTSTESLNQIGSRIHHRFNFARGLVVLEESTALGAAAVNASEEIWRNRLLTRIDQLKQSGMFEYVEPDYIVHLDLAPTDQAFANGTLWGLRNLGQNGGTPGADIGATSAWDLTTGDTNVIVAVIDSGIRYTHKDLAKQMWRNPGEIAGNAKDDDGDGYVDNVFGINAITGSGDPNDDNDHGTHVAGTIGAAANDGNPHVGVTWRVRLMACKFSNAQGIGRTSDAIKCIDFAVSKGARILNNSWGGSAYSQALFDSINAARSKGVLFVAAAGNDGVSNDQSPHYPANYPLDNIISVAAVDRNDNLAGFSDYGLKTVHLGAPGVDIYSSTAGSDTEYQVFNGTSMAAPHASGVAALIASQFPGADADEMRARILAGTVPILALNGVTTTGGRLNAYNAMTFPGNGILSASVNPPSGSILLTSSAQPIFVKVLDVFGVHNATVSATIAGITNLTFINNGQPPDVLSNDSTYSILFQVPAATNPVTMTLIATAPGKIGVTNIVNYTIVPPPPNDYFSNATKVPAGGAVYLANNRFATIETSEPVHAGISNRAASLWWTWSPTVSTNAFIDTTGSSIDSVVAVYTGSSLTKLQLVAATNDVGQQKQAFLRFSAESGQVYHIAVASVSTNSLGSVEVRVAPGGRPDTTPPEVFVTSPLSGLTVSNKLISLIGTAIDPAPDATGVNEVLFSVNGAMASSANGTSNWTATALLQLGYNVIVVRAVDEAGNFSQPVTLQINYLANDPVNDFFANAIPLTGSSGNSAVSNTNATKEVGEPDHASVAGGHSVWWSFAPSLDGALTLSTSNSTFDTVLAIYTGTNVSNLTPVGSNDDAFSGVPGGFSQIVQAVKANQTYHIAVDGYDGAAGDVFLAYSFVPSTLYSLTINNTSGGHVTPSSGEVVGGATAVLTATPNESFEFANWTGSFTSTANPLSVVVNSNINLTANFRPVAYEDDFETGNLSKLNWITIGGRPWFVQPSTVYAGTYSAQSGAIGNGQTTSLILATNFAGGPGSFYFKVSSEDKWDFLSFHVDGNLVQKWSGEVAWANFTFPLSAGSHTLEWRYTKDASLSDGLDAAFLDNVDLPLAASVNTSSPALLQLVGQSDGGLTLQLQGQPNQLYVIQSSTNFTSWQSVSTNFTTDGVIRFVDPSPTTNPFRFYRAIVP